MAVGIETFEGLEALDAVFDSVEFQFRNADYKEPLGAFLPELR